MPDHAEPTPPHNPAPGAPLPGWWQASDGNWYPPDATPGPPRPEVSPTAASPDDPTTPGGIGDVVVGCAQLIGLTAKLLLLLGLLVLLLVFVWAAITT